MSVKGEIKEGRRLRQKAMGEHGKSPESQRKPRKAATCETKAAVEDGKTPKTTKPGNRSPRK